MIRRPPRSTRTDTLFPFSVLGLALSGPVQPGLHEILHVETGTRPFLRSFGEEWKLLPPDAMQLFHLFDAIPPKARAVLFRQIENPTFPVESREVRWHPAFDPVHQEERFIKHSSRDRKS